MSSMIAQQVSAEQLADVLADTAIQATIDLGSSFVHTGLHKVMGNITVIATFGDRHAVIKSAM